MTDLFIYVYILIYGVILVCNENTHTNIRNWCEYLLEIHAANDKISRMKKTHATEFTHIELKMELMCLPYKGIYTSVYKVSINSLYNIYIYINK